LKIKRYSYDVFGEPTIKGPSDEPRDTSDVNNPYMFTGRRYDTETGLYYYRLRYYAPDIGRFLQTDPIRYAAGLNLYTYVRNNPINWIDPWGLCKEAVRLTREEFEERVKDVIERRLRGSRLTGINPFNYYYDADSEFYNDNTLYEYMGNYFTGEEINYYVQGVLQRHYYVPERVGGLMVRMNNWRYLHEPTQGEYVWTIIGREEYDYWKK